MEKLRVLFVWPNYQDTMLGLPLGIGYLISNCRDERFEFELIDCALDDLKSTDPELAHKIKAFSPSILAISASSSNFNEAVAILRMSKELNGDITTIIGGPHATAYGRQAFEGKEIDFLFMGEGEIGFKDFLRSFVEPNAKNYSEIEGLAYKDKNGNQYFSEPANIENLDSLLPPDYDSINLDRYIDKGYHYLSSKERCVPIYATRGCPYRCKFCSVPSISGNIVRKHSISYLANIIKYLYEKKKIRGFNIVDDNFTFDVSFAKDFCREIIKLNLQDIEFNSPNGVRMQRGDFELWALMKKAGWNIITVAPESGSPRVLKLMKKDLDPCEVPAIITDMKKAGLGINGFFMLGFPGETIEDLKETENLIRLCRFDNLSVTSFQPMPGTPIYDELIEQGDLCTHQLPGYFCDSDNDTLVYKTKSLDGIDLLKYRKQLEKLSWFNDGLETLSMDENLDEVANLFIAGAGSYTVRILEKLEKFGIPVDGIVDEISSTEKIRELNIYSLNRNTFDKEKIGNSIFLVAISGQHYRSNAFGRLLNNGVPLNRIIYIEPSVFDVTFENQLMQLFRKIPYFKQSVL